MSVWIRIYCRRTLAELGEGIVKAHDDSWWEIGTAGGLVRLNLSR